MKRKKASETAPLEGRSPCAVACGLDIFGDRWTLLVVRDLLRGHRRYGEFAGSKEKIPTNLLADRLSRLETAGIVTRTPYQDNPPRYEYALTPKGDALRPIIRAIADWGAQHIPGTRRMDMAAQAAATGDKPSSR
ncbi:MAG: putative transcriptional regulator [Verrucomicrobia bacterium]|nr:putative transcriptional regulator [Verrucomicrobiota bacterium]